jgi:hypothetical protein
VAVAVVPLPPSVEVMLPVVFTLAPSTEEVTFATMLHDPPATSVPPDRLTLPDPTAAVAVPPQVLVNPLGFPTSNPVGKLSVKLTPERPFPAFGLLILNVSVVVPLTGILGAPKLFVNVGGPMTASVAVLLGAPVPLWVDEIAPVVFGFAPGVVPVTFTANPHDVFTASATPDRLMVPVPDAAVGTTPHVLFANPFGVATTRPAGNASVKVTPVSELVFATGFVRVNVSVVDPLTGTLGAPKALLIVGAVATLRFAVLLVVPVPPLVDEMAPVVLESVPALVAFTFTASVHAALAATVPPAKLTVPAAAVGVPPHVLVSPFGVATTRPDGSVSENATPVAANVLAPGFVTVNVKVVFEFSGIAVGLNALLINGGASTARLAEAGRPVPPSVDMMLPVVLFLAPAVVPVTFTTRLHELGEFASTLPDKVTVPVPAVAVIGPPHVLDTTGMGDSTKPAGKLSVKPTPVSPVAAFGFVMLNVSVVEPFNGMLAAPKIFVNVGGPMTVSVAVLLGLPAPLSFDEIASVVFGFPPAVLAVTFTTRVHCAPGLSVTLDKLTTPDPATAFAVPPGAPRQVPPSPFGFATTRPPGRVSEKVIPVRGLVFPPGLVIVKVNVELVFTGIVCGLNALVIVGGVATPRFAVLLVVPVPPLVDEIAPVVLESVPGAIPVTFTASVHDAFVATVPPVRLTDTDPGPAVGVPPHVLVSPLGVATTRPAGSGSENATPVLGTVLARGFRIVNVKVVEEFSGMPTAPNALVIIGGATTVRFAAPLGLPVPPFVEEAAKPALLSAPARLPTTFTETAQDELAGMEPPEREKLPAPGVGASVPPHELTKPVGAATVSCTGMVVVKATPLRASGFPTGFVIVMFRAVATATGVVLGLKV